MLLGLSIASMASTSNNSLFKLHVSVLNTKQMGVVLIRYHNYQTPLILLTANNALNNVLCPVSYSRYNQLQDINKHDADVI